MPTGPQDRPKGTETRGQNDRLGNKRPTGASPLKRASREKAERAHHIEERDDNDVSGLGQNLQ